MNLRRFLPGILFAQVVLLSLLGWHFRHEMNTDAVAYLRLGSYYAEGKLDLAVSGYWGPQLSWLIALGLKLGLPLLVAGRVVMGLSSLAFTFGAAEIYRALKLPAKWSVSGIILAALASAYWSVQFITPDLLLSAWMMLAVSRMLDDRWLIGRWPAVSTGLFWGLAYLTKAVALPVGAVSIICFAALGHRRAQTTRWVSIRRAATTVLVFIMVASPWMLVLTNKYGRPTFSTTPRISHTLTGPPDQERYHPFARTFHRPEPGRVSSLEDPSRMNYNYWSPLAGVAYAKHQLKVIAQNVVTALILFTSINLAWPVCVVAFGMSRRNSPMRKHLTNLLLVPVIVAVVYLPCYFTLTEQRFFFVILPLFYGAFALCSIHSDDLTTRFPRFWKIILNRQILILATALPLLAQMILIGDQTIVAGECAVELSGRLRTAQLHGSFAGSASLPGGRTGLYVSFFLGQPWFGDESNPTPDSIKTSGADFFVVNRRSALAESLATNSTFINLDPQLFATPDEANHFPVMVFQVGK